uniref:Uncharacterized protein n=1 Tax=Rhizophora mucronata TaxID=61149 RepID=A0A2P2NLP9_RHIMU
MKQAGPAICVGSRVVSLIFVFYFFFSNILFPGSKLAILLNELQMIE